MDDFILQILLRRGLGYILAANLTFVILGVSILIICVLADKLAKLIIIKALGRFIKHTKTKWDDYLIERKVFHKVAHFVPAVIIYLSAPMFKWFEEVIRRGAICYFLILGGFLLSALLYVANDVYMDYPVAKTRPIKGFLQVVRIIMYIIMLIVLIANVIGQSPLILLSGIGALAAVFSLVFKDAILGLVAGIQLTSNDMLRIGDWIEMPKYEANGNVIDLSLNTVKVQNFDKAIISIPAYALVSDSFRNWRGMEEAGGRRIKRALYIDTTSVGFCSEELMEKFRSIYLLKDYMNEKEVEIQQYNERRGVKNPINGRHLTNLGVFRIYIENYLRSHPGINQEMSMMVRQLQPGEYGIPLEVYAFTNETKWAAFEVIQADIFDHILSVVNEFALRLFQNPTGHDFSRRF